MVVGFNHNFRYKGEIYHVQTEDSGLNTPHIITLLYRGGTILASKKTSYADIIKVDNLERIVEELMKEQHKEMLYRLRKGEFDSVLFKGQQVKTSTVEPPAETGKAPASPPLSRSVESAVNVSTPEPSKPSVPSASLDEIILSYLAGESDKS